MELYIHIPFCRSKCAYCDFASWAGQEEKIQAYVDAVLSEALWHARYLGGTSVDTVFVGGGTPSLLPTEELERLLCGAMAMFPLRDGAQVTMEANPGTVTAEWARMAQECGVNRVSMGMQALQPQLLKTLGRIHTFDEVNESVAILRDAGIDNINLDLMFGLPGQTREMWRHTLHAALSLAPTHLSCYGLIPEEGTPLMGRLEAGLISLPDEEQERLMYSDAISLLRENGFAQYEISNFAKPGMACRHNLGYWRQVPYVGLGAFAASMLRMSDGEHFSRRLTNPRSIDDYIRMVNTRQWQEREENLITHREASFETVMLGLRTTEGVSEQEFTRLHGITMEERFGDKLEGLAQKGLLRHADRRWCLTERGMDIQNSVLVQLMDE